MFVYLAVKHPDHPYWRGRRTVEYTVEKAFSTKKDAQDFVNEKNKRATYSRWSVKAKKVI